MALAQAGDAARGATVYVTLEPCSHHGHTPPCAQALIDAGVAHVVGAIQDSDPRVNGAGFDMLHSAGIKVTTGVCAEMATVDHAGFFAKTTLGRPFLTLKLANSFDGRIATASGDSQWITGPQARRLVHGMRANHDAVLVGAGTARADDPMLTVRGMGVSHQPVRIIMSRKLDLPTDSALANSTQDAPLWLCHSDEAPVDRIYAWQDRGATMIECAVENGRIAIFDLMKKLAERGLTRIFCEGGGTLAASLLLADVVDHLVGFQAGVVIGAEGQPAIGALGFGKLSEAPEYELKSLQTVGGDILHTWSKVHK
jgi:diaminohydroxyphosphoribosylaminopyrimidine deaminase/5-amino-6-(5-phosphoribosylamino)uracil reductase